MFALANHLFGIVHDQERLRQFAIWLSAPCPDVKAEISLNKAPAS
jgi:hypothetical protein